MLRAVLAVALVLVTLGFAGDWALHRSLFSARHVEVRGARHESVAAVIAVSGLADHPPLIDVRTAAVADRIAAHFPWVSSARVTLRWPDSVEIDLTEQRPVAVAFDVAHVLHYVGENGRELSRAPLGANYPTLVYEHPLTATWPFARAGRNAATVAARLPVAFAAQVAAIDVAASGWVTLQMTTPVRFVLGLPTQLNDKFASIAAVIAHATLRPGDVVDVTVPGSLAVTGPSPSPGG